MLKSAERFSAIARSVMIFAELRTDHDRVQDGCFSAIARSVMIFAGPSPATCGPLSSFSAIARSVMIFAEQDWLDAEYVDKFQCYSS